MPILKIFLSAGDDIGEDVHSFWCKPFLLVETIVSIDFVVFKDHLIAISGYLYTPCADQNVSEI